MGNVIEFQIEENWGHGCKGYIYFSTNKTTSIDDLKIIAKNEAKKDWERICEYPKLIGTHIPFRPTILVSEYANGKKVRGGIKFKTKWC